MYLIIIKWHKYLRSEWLGQRLGFWEGGGGFKIVRKEVTEI